MQNNIHATLFINTHFVLCPLQNWLYNLDVAVFKMKTIKVCQIVKIPDNGKCIMYTVDAMQNSNTVDAVLLFSDVRLSTPL